MPLEVSRDLLGSFVRVEFIDHFHFDKISKKKLLLNVENYSINSAVGDVLEINDSFLILRNSWSDNHELVAGIAIFRPSIRRIVVLEEGRSSRHAKKSRRK